MDAVGAVLRRKRKMYHMVYLSRFGVSFGGTLAAATDTHGEFDSSGRCSVGRETFSSSGPAARGALFTYPWHGCGISSYLARLRVVPALLADGGCPGSEVGP